MPFQVPTEVYQAEEQGIIGKFYKKYLDHEIEDIITKGESPVDLSSISCYRVILTKAQKEMEQHRISRDTELAHRVAQASLEEMLHHITGDTELIREYNTQVKTARRSIESNALCYKKRRYETGVKRVNEKLSELLLYSTGTPSEFPQRLKTMITSANKTRTGISKNTSGT